MSNLGEMTLHDLRRSCASLLVALDMHPRVIPAILRHARIAMSLDVYAPFKPELHCGAMAKLNALPR